MNYKSIIITSILSGVITIATSVILFWVQLKVPELTYNSLVSIPFDDDHGRLYIQQINIRNDGNKLVEDVILIIKTAQDIINKSKISIDPTIAYKKIVEKDSFKMEIDSLNPGENVKITLLVENINNKKTSSHISLRGNGIKGEAIGERKNKIAPFIFIPLLAAYAGIFSFIFYNNDYRFRIISLFKELISGKSHFVMGGQNYAVASIFAMHGFPDKAKGYLDSSAPRQYWAEADLLSAEAIKEKESVEFKEKTIRILKNFMEIPFIASSSKSIVAYNISRIYKVLEKNDKVSEYLSIAKKFDQKEIELRLAKDPLFQTTEVLSGVVGVVV